MIDESQYCDLIKDLANALYTKTEECEELWAYIKSLEPNIQFSYWFESFPNAVTVIRLPLRADSVNRFYAYTHNKDHCVMSDYCPTFIQAIKNLKERYDER